MDKTPNAIPDVAQSPAECAAFVEAFARLTVQFIKHRLGSPLDEAAAKEQALSPDWDDEEKLASSGLTAIQIDAEARAGRKYLHVDAARGPYPVRAAFLALTGLSDKQRKLLFPVLRARSKPTIEALAPELQRLNAWLDDVRTDGFNLSQFVAYQRALSIHGAGQNLSGAIGAAGAVIAFRDAIEELAPGAIVDTVGELPPVAPTNPTELMTWMSAPERVVRTLLLANGRAVVFASSKDANIFQPLNGKFASATEALQKFNAVRNNQKARAQTLHEFAVGEIKTATDPANLHERMGLASRETPTELRTDRFLMMALLNAEILAGGVQGRTMNNRDLVRFSDVFNLHHCWGWDGGREAHPEHWAYFKDKVREWCGL